MSATPIDVATPALRAASAEVLLDAVVVLTHQIHGLSDASGDGVEELRARRELIRTELLRRIQAVSS